jgi:hypothetical protein
MQGRLRTGALVVAAMLALAVCAISARADSGALAARSCTAPDYPGSGYFTSLTVKRTTCAAGRKLARAYYRCRTETGPAGRCQRRVLGYTCSEQRNSIPTELDARVRCKRGAKRVTHTYQQDL